MKLYDCILSIYQERKDFDAAEKKLREAEKAAKKFGHNYVWAQYYSLLSAFYDHVLGGAYDAVEADEELLLKKMMDATDKTIRYARKSHRPGSKHLLAENLLAKATMLIRSKPESKKQIDKLLSEAEKIVFAETQPYAEVRCIYYMVKAWYATLVVPSFEDTLIYISKANEISNRITPTDLDEIDNMVIPSADMMCIFSGVIIIQKSPVSVVPVKITQQRIRNKHIPEMCPKNRRRDILLPVDGIHDVIQLRSAAVAVGIENRILDGTEVEQALPAGGKVLAGTHGFRFALDGIVAEDRFLRRNPQHIENAAGNVLADTAIGIGQLCWLSVPGGRELQHIDLTSIRNRDLASVGSVISAPRDDLAACKVNHCFPPNKNFFRR